MAGSITVLSNPVMLCLEVLCAGLCVIILLMNGYVLMVRSAVGQTNEALNIFGPICVLPGIQCILSVAKTRNRNKYYRIFLMILFAAPMFALTILFEEKLISEWTIYSVVLVCFLLPTTPLMKKRHQKDPKLMLSFGCITFLLFMTSVGYLMGQYSNSMLVDKCCDGWEPPEVNSTNSSNATSTTTSTTEVNSTGPRRLVDPDGAEDSPSADEKNGLMSTLSDWSRRLAKGGGGKAKKGRGAVSTDYEKCPLLLPCTLNTGQLLAMQRCKQEAYCDGTRGEKAGCAQEDAEDLLIGSVYWLKHNDRNTQGKGLFFMSVLLVVVNQEVYHHLAHNFSETRFESLSFAFIEWILLIVSLGVTTTLGVCWAIEFSPNHRLCSRSLLLYFATVCAFRCWSYRQPEPELGLPEDNDAGGGDGAPEAEVTETTTQQEKESNDDGGGVGALVVEVAERATQVPEPFDINDISETPLDISPRAPSAIASHSELFAQTPRLPKVEASRDESAAPAPGGCCLGCGLGSCPVDRCASREEISGYGTYLSAGAARVQQTPPATDESLPAPPVAGDGSVQCSSTEMGPCSSVTTHAPEVEFRAKKADEDQLEETMAKEEKDKRPPIRTKSDTVRTASFSDESDGEEERAAEDAEGDPEGPAPPVQAQKWRPSTASAFGGRSTNFSQRVSAVRNFFMAFQNHHRLFRPLLRAGTFSGMVGTFAVAFQYKMDPMHSMMMTYPFLLFSVMFSRILYAKRQAIFFTLIWVMLDAVMCCIFFNNFSSTTPAFHLADFSHHLHMVSTVVLMLGFTAISWLIPTIKNTSADLWVMSGNFLVAVPLVVDIICKYYTQSMVIAVLCDGAIDAANCIPADVTAPIVDDPSLMPVKDLRPMHNASYSSQTTAIRVAGMQLLCCLFLVMLPSYWARALDAYNRAIVFQLTTWEWLHGICTATLVFASIFVETKNLGPYYTAFEIISMVNVVLLVALLLNHRSKQHLRKSQQERTSGTSKKILLVIFVMSVVLDLAFTGFSVLSYAAGSSPPNATLKSFGKDWAIPPFLTTVFPMMTVRAAQMLKWHKKRCSTLVLAFYCFFRVMYSFGLGHLYHAAEFSLLPQPLSITSWIAPTSIGLVCFGMLRFIMIDATVNRRNHMMVLLASTPAFATILSRVICFDHAVGMYPGWKGSRSTDVMVKLADADPLAGPAKVQEFRDLFFMSWQIQAQITLFINLIIWPSFWIPYTQLSFGRINIGEIRCIEKVNFVIWAMLITACLVHMSAFYSRELAGLVTSSVPVLQVLHIGWLCILVNTHSNENLQSRMQIFFTDSGTTSSMASASSSAASSMASAPSSGRSMAAALTGQESYQSVTLNEDSDAHRLSLVGKDGGDEIIKDAIDSFNDVAPM